MYSKDRTVCPKGKHHSMQQLIYCKELIMLKWDVVWYDIWRCLNPTCKCFTVWSCRRIPRCFPLILFPSHSWFSMHTRHFSNLVWGLHWSCTNICSDEWFALVNLTKMALISGDTSLNYCYFGSAVIDVSGLFVLQLLEETWNGCWLKHWR